MGEPAVTKRGPGRPPVSISLHRNLVGGWKGAVKMASNFQIGQKVSYKHGKGSFGTTVIEIDDQGMVTEENKNKSC